MMQSLNPILMTDPGCVGYSRDPMTLGPVLPDGWSGDAWVQGNPHEPVAYCVRAWPMMGGRVILGRGLRYEDACDALKCKVRCG